MEYGDYFEPTEGIYLLNHSVGRPPKDIHEKVGQSFFQAWQTGRPDPWQQWLETIDRFRASLAVLLNAKASEFCPQTNLSSGFTKLLQALHVSPERKTLLVSENDFPSMGFVAQQAEKWGFQLRWLPKDFAFTSAEAWRAQIKPDLAAVFVSHVHYNTNTQVPVAEITKMARQNSVFSIVDIAQSVGVIPIDLAQWQADAVLGSCVKWLCGGPGAAFLWLREECHQSLQPKDVGWFSHQNPFEFDIKNFEYAAGVNRFWGGTPSVLAYDVARCSIDLINSIGVERIYQHNRSLTAKLIEGVGGSLIVTPPQPHQRGGTIVVKPHDQEMAQDRLTASHVQFDARAMGIRLSPHIYNTESQIETVIDCLGER